MNIPTWKCKCPDKRNAMGVPRCKKCGAIKTEANITESGHIEVRREAPAIKRPKVKKAPLPKAIEPGESDNFLTSTMKKL